MFDRKMIKKFFVGGFLSALVFASSLASANDLNPVYSVTEENQGKFFQYKNFFNNSGVPDESGMRKRYHDMMLKAKEIDPVIKLGGYTYNGTDAISYLKDLGYNTKNNKELFFFISWDMPKKLIKRVLMDAVETGGEVVAYGVPKDIDNIGDYFTKKIFPLIRKDGLNPNLTMDPTKFEAFDIKVVPSIVYSENANHLCEKNDLVKKTYKHKTFEVDRCSLEDPSTYIKISGAVTAKYALDQFKENGFDVNVYLKNQQEFISTGGNNVRELAKKKGEEFGEYENGVVKPYDFSVGFFKDR